MTDRFVAVVISGIQCVLDTKFAVAAPFDASAGKAAAIMVGNVWHKCFGWYPVKFDLSNPGPHPEAQQPTPTAAETEQANGN